MATEGIKEVITKSKTGASTPVIEIGARQRISDLPITWNIGNKYSPLRNSSDIKYALDLAINKNQHTITIWLLVNQMKFKPEFNPLDMEEWGTENDIDNDTFKIHTIKRQWRHQIANNHPGATKIHC